MQSVLQGLCKLLFSCNYLNYVYIFYVVESRLARGHVIELKLFRTHSARSVCFNSMHSSHEIVLESAIMHSSARA